MIHYGVSKTALLAVSRGFAKDAAGTGHDKSKGDQQGKVIKLASADAGQK